MIAAPFVTDMKWSSFAVDRSLDKISISDAFLIGYCWATFFEDIFAKGEFWAPEEQHDELCHLWYGLRGSQLRGGRVDELVANSDLFADLRHPGIEEA